MYRCPVPCKYIGAGSQKQKPNRLKSIVVKLQYGFKRNVTVFLLKVNMPAFQNTVSKLAHVHSTKPDSAMHSRVH